MAPDNQEGRVLAKSRKRPLPFLGANGLYQDRQESTNPLNPFVYTTDYPTTWRPANLQGSEETYSEYHPGWRRQLGARHDIGGKFSNVKRYVESMPIGSEHFVAQQHYPPYVTNTQKYRGPVLVHSGVGFTFPPIESSSDSVLDAVGAGVIARVNPTNAVASAGTALAELYREGLPKAVGASLWKLRLDDIVKGAGDDYLNVAFGWNPLVSEIRNFAYGLDNASKLIRQFHRDSGRVVRRRYSMPPVKSVESIVYQDNTTPHTLSSFPGMYKTGSPKGKVIRIRTKTKRVWFSGAFTYHSGMETYRPAAVMESLGYDARRLLGLELTPTMLYNLTPWSWAADWVSSLGDVISNLESQQRYGLVMPYGYLMEHIVTRDSYVWGGVNPLVNDPPITPLTLVTETKLRRPANPFGFGLTWASLDDTQKAILAALGISKRYGG